MAISHLILIYLIVRLCQEAKKMYNEKKNKN